ncbi:MAG: DUF1109 family protein [Methylobacteriaceae bacterium]|nr:DUF1109 family protein [Methylobacteriaceae bacterium]
MRTDDLIAALAADPPQAARPLSGRALMALAPAAALIGLMFLILVGVRHDIALPSAAVATGLKMGVAALAAGGGLALALRLSAPGARPGAAALPLAAALAALALWIAWEFAALGPAGWPRRLIGTNAVYCLTLIPLMALVPLAALLAALRAGAPERPARAGAFAGLAAAGVAAAVYATHCTDDSPLFVLAWYSLAALAVSGLGALLAARLLRW